MADSEIALIALVIVFYVLGFAIAFYIRIAKIVLIRRIKETGRVITLSQTLVAMMMQHLQNHRRYEISPSTGLPPPPPYTAEAPPTISSELPPSYAEPPPYSK